MPMATGKKQLDLASDNKKNSSPSTLASSWAERGELVIRTFKNPRLAGGGQRLPATRTVNYGCWHCGTPTTVYANAPEVAPRAFEATFLHDRKTPVEGTGLGSEHGV